MNIDHPEVQMFFRQAMVARISTVSCSGRPSITPLYFNYVNGKIWLGTSTWTLAAREVSNDSHVCILLQYEKQKSDPRILRIMGTATIRTDDAALRLRDRKMALKYVLSLEDSSTTRFIYTFLHWFANIVPKAMKKGQDVLLRLHHSI